MAPVELVTQQAEALSPARTTGLEPHITELVRDPDESETLLPLFCKLTICSFIAYHGLTAKKGDFCDVRADLDLDGAGAVLGSGEWPVLISLFLLIMMSQGHCFGLSPLDRHCEW